MISKNFKELNKKDVQIAGGKGASLAEMINAGFHVPDGFVVLSTAFDEFIKDTDINIEIDSILKSVDTQKIHTVDAASEKIQAFILNAEIPEFIINEIQEKFNQLDSKYVAVRSSATAEDGISAAWAGQLDTFLNTRENNLFENIKKCWASLFTPRAIFYRFEQNLDKENISVAVVIQKMINSEKSGIAFSVHPITEDYNQLVIEAGLGLGESIVSGQITPDTYVVDKELLKIIDKNIITQSKALYRGTNGGNEWREILEENGAKQILSNEKIIELSKIIIKIEDHYKLPQDIEWAVENDKFYIVQSRPITTLKSKKNQKKKNDINLGELSDYQRMFKWESLLPYLMSSIFIGHYKSLNVLLISKLNLWVSYLPFDSLKKTLNDGVKIYGDEIEYKEYIDNFDKQINESEKYFKKILEKEKVNLEDSKKFLDFAIKTFEFYSKTEFFYTDQAFLEQKNNQIIKGNFKSFEGFKLEGRKYLNRVVIEADSYLSKFVEKISNQFNIDIASVWGYDRNEILDLFEGKVVEEKILKDRNIAYIFKSENQKESSLYGEKVKQIVEDFIDIKKGNCRTIKGQIANKGKVRGRAKVFRLSLEDYDSSHDLIDSMKEGDILIAETTDPKIILACNKASAIVTNQGGMMSHAAIVSRELDIPCIVGTSIATDIILDGQEIEVDANNGIVRLFDEIEK